MLVRINITIIHDVGRHMNTSFRLQTHAHWIYTQARAIQGHIAHLNAYSKSREQILKDSSHQNNTKLVSYSMSQILFTGLWINGMEVD